MYSVKQKEKRFGQGSSTFLGCLGDKCLIKVQGLCLLVWNKSSFAEVTAGTHGLPEDADLLFPVSGLFLVSETRLSCVGCSLSEKVVCQKSQRCLFSLWHAAVAVSWQTCSKLDAPSEGLGFCARSMGWWHKPTAVGSLLQWSLEASQR